VAASKWGVGVWGGWVGVGGGGCKGLSCHSTGGGGERGAAAPVAASGWGLRVVVWRGVSE
jgi:hypothetical protein